MKRLSSLAAVILMFVSAANAQNLKDTVQWIQNSLNANQGNTFYGSEGNLEKRILTVPSASSCEVTFEYKIMSGNKTTFKATDKLNLKDINPSTIRTVRAGKDSFGSTSLFFAETTNYADAITLQIGGDDYSVQSSDLLFELPTAYAYRFEKAFKHAVALCGGKPSTF
jgi:hypothetical protein